MDMTQAEAGNVLAWLGLVFCASATARRRPCSDWSTGPEEWSGAESNLWAGPGLAEPSLDQRNPDDLPSCDQEINAY